MSYQNELDVATAIARKSGAVMLKYFEGDQHQQQKEDNTPVTIADTEVNSLVISELAKSFPEDGVIGEEESTAEYGMGRRWICDPIDGTNAFIWGVPTAMFSLALVVDGVPVVGVTYDPFLDKLYTGVKGEGSFHNGQPLKVSAQSLDNGAASVSSSITTILKRPKYMVELSNRGTISLFSGAVYRGMLIARGRLTCFALDKLNAHDLAAIDVILTEAGGKVTDWDGHPIDYSKPFFNGAIASNGVVHDELVELIHAK